MGNVISLSNRKTDNESHSRQVQRSIRLLDDAIKAAEAGLRLTELKSFRTAINQMKNARYVMQKEINKLDSGS